MIYSNGIFCPFSSLLSTYFTREFTNHVSMTLPSVGICPLSISTKSIFVAFFAHHSLHWLNPRLANTELILAIIISEKEQKEKNAYKARFLVFPVFTSCSSNSLIFRVIHGFNPHTSKHWTHSCIINSEKEQKKKKA